MKTKNKKEHILDTWKLCWGIEDMQTALLLEQEERYLKNYAKERPVHEQNGMLLIMEALKNNDKYFHISDIFDVSLVDSIDDKYNIYNLQQNEITYINRADCRPHPLIPSETEYTVNEYSLSNTYSKYILSLNERSLLFSGKIKLFEKSHYTEANTLYKLIKNHIIEFNKNSNTSIKSMILSSDMFNLLKGVIKKDFKVNQETYEQLHLNYVGTFDKKVSMYEYKLYKSDKIIFVADSKLGKIPKKHKSVDPSNLGTNIISNETSVCISIFRPFIIALSCVEYGGDKLSYPLCTVCSIDFMNTKNINKLVFK